MRSFLRPRRPSACAALLLSSIAAIWTPHVFADVPTAEHDVLVALFTGTNGAGWTHREHWNTADPICPGVAANNWYGVTCDAGNTHVVQLVLQNNNLVGALPDLSALASLQTFDLANPGSSLTPNQLSGPLPRLSGLTRLQTFSAFGNQLGGPIPPLSALTNLQTFAVDANQLSGPLPSLSGLAALRDFEVQNNQLTGSIPPLTGLTSLKWFDVSANQLTGPLPALAGLTQLVEFRAASNRLSGGMPTLSGLTNLGVLDVAHNALSGALASDLFVSVGALTNISLQSNGFSGAIPTAPSSLFNGGSAVCPNAFDHALDSAWDAATGTVPWFASCTAQTTTTTLSLSPSAATIGESVTANVIVTPPSGNGAPPGGNILVSDSADASARCVAPLTSTCTTTSCVLLPLHLSCALNFATGGTHTVTAAYSGDANYAPSSGSASETVDAPPGIDITAPKNVVSRGAYSTVFVSLGNLAAMADVDIDQLVVSLSFPAASSGYAIESNSCGGTTSATSASNTVTLTGGRLLESQGCVLKLQVYSSATGTITASVAAGAMQTSAGGNRAAVTASIQVVEPIPPTATPAFAPASIVTGGTSMLTITLANANTTDLRLVSLTGSLPAGLVVAHPANASTTCAGASVVAAPGADSFAVEQTAAILPVSILPAAGDVAGTCVVRVAVQATAPGNDTLTLAAGALRAQTIALSLPPSIFAAVVDVDSSSAASATLAVTPAMPAVPAPILDARGAALLAALLALTSLHRKFGRRPNGGVERGVTPNAI